ncbi:MAG: hypothetical protein K0B11_05585 [Mariniphaga sp.]|nr:hypothetical protein [Mariniphaga sp.]
MKAIEIKAKTDDTGNLKLDIPLKRKNRQVKILILFKEDDELLDNENVWLYFNSNNPSLDFLNEPEEDIYSLTDGEPINHD